MIIGFDGFSLDHTDSRITYFGGDQIQLPKWWCMVMSSLRFGCLFHIIFVDRPRCVRANVCVFVLRARHTCVNELYFIVLSMLNVVRCRLCAQVLNIPI